ncbi:MAG: hypothetical protein V1690_00310 [Candidatus Moraniibacteriota bacterium]
MENLGPYDAGVPFRKFIFVFLLVCVVVGAGVFYSALSRATVTIIPKSSIKEVTTEVLIDGNQSYPDLDKGLIPGEIKIREAEGQEKGIEVASKRIDEFARGKVLIHNSTPYAQGIRQGAGLKPVGAPEGVTFVTASRVMLPPKQSREVDVIATMKGAKGNLPPGKFDLLNLDTKYMQDNLWAENKEKIEGGIREAKVVLNEDIESAYDALAKKMFQKTLEEMNRNLGEGKVVKEDSSHYTVIEKKATVMPGAEAENFDVNLKIEVQGATINENDLQSIAEKKIQTLGDANEEFVKSEPDSFSYSLTELNLTDKKAVLRAKMKGLFHIKLSSKVFDKKSIIGYNEQAIREHFSHFDNISGVEVTFWPPFRKTVPNVESRIEIGVKTE